MAFWSLGKKHEDKNCVDSSFHVKNEDTGCCCDDGVNKIKSIKILGPGCKNCHGLSHAINDALQKIGMRIEVDNITDLEQIAEYGAMSMPALVINEQVVSMGKVLKSSDIIKLFKKLGYWSGSAD